MFPINTQAWIVSRLTSSISRFTASAANDVRPADLLRMAESGEKLFQCLSAKKGDAQCSDPRHTGTPMQGRNKVSFAAKSPVMPGGGVWLDETRCEACRE